MSDLARDPPVNIEEELKEFPIWITPASVIVDELAGCA